MAGIKSILMVARVPPGTVDSLPKDPRTVVNKMDLDPRTTSYLQCPACYALYPFSGTGLRELPPDTLEHCSHRPTPDSAPCGVPLWRDRRVGATNLKTPARKYVHQSLKEWVGRLLARPGIEDTLDTAYNKPVTDRATDIWDSPVFKNFHDVDGTPFFSTHGHEVRLAFSLGVDSFHPLGALEAKQSMSATAIFMVLLNFPKEQRFKYKNMYLAGVIPGPSKPSLEQINHALSLLVVELLEFWRGIFFTRTYKFSGGRLSKGAMIPLVTDMLTARQVAGFGSVTSMLFCTFCLLTIQDIENLEKSTWPQRTLHNHLECAREWRNCRSERDRERLFKLHGLRWSALLDLPYWNPILYTVLDSMHAAFLGLFQTHCRKVWRINVSIEGGDGSLLRPEKTLPRPPDSVLLKWLRLIKENPKDLLQRLNAENIQRNILWHICVDNSLRHVGGKRALAKGIVEWVRLSLYLGFYRSEPLQRSQVSPDEIPLPGETEDVDMDQPIASGSADSENEFERRLAIAEKALLESSDDRGLARRTRKDALQVLCRNRRLDDKGDKIELASRLINWVGCPPLVIQEVKSTPGSAKYPPTTERHRATNRDTQSPHR